ncbi:hypothetical protein ColTof4_00640 [Colletotrichum tofieldiae]|nr:hypothetical protein ColTof3_07851 [Colletotrichum tofieldiae]GKT68217.1 hypothetical protein ColTof4_00640 [Colletotrichum tofieldiae]
MTNNSAVSSVLGSGLGLWDFESPVVIPSHPKVDEAHARQILDRPSVRDLKRHAGASPLEVGKRQVIGAASVVVEMLRLRAKRKKKDTAREFHG